MDIIGEIKVWTGLFEPPGWTFCDGKYLVIREFPELFSVIGYQFGGSGDSFALPGLDSIIPNTSFIICYDGYLPSDKKKYVIDSVINKTQPERIKANYIDPRKSKKFINRTIPQIKSNS